MNSKVTKLNYRLDFIYSEVKRKIVCCKVEGFALQPLTLGGIINLRRSLILLVLIHVSCFLFIYLLEGIGIEKSVIAGGVTVLVLSGLVVFFSNSIRSPLFAALFFTVGLNLIGMFFFPGLMKDVSVFSLTHLNYALKFFVLSMAFYLLVWRVWK